MYFLKSNNKNLKKKRISCNLVTVVVQQINWKSWISIMIIKMIFQQWKLKNNIQKCRIRNENQSMNYQQQKSKNKMSTMKTRKWNSNNKNIIMKIQKSIGTMKIQTRNYNEMQWMQRKRIMYLIKLSTVILSNKIWTMTLNKRWISKNENPRINT